MSRSHNVRHAWKNGERRRTGISDPPKIRLHRERFLARLKAQQKPVDLTTKQPTGRIVMLIRLLTIPNVEEPRTLIYRDGEIIAEAEHWAINPEDVEYLVAKADGVTTLDANAEKARLAEHVGLITERSLSCHLEARQPKDEEEDGEQLRICESCFSCPFRLWNEEHSLPLCTRSQS